MKEFAQTSWMSNIVTYNYSGSGAPSSTYSASACLSNGCVYHKDDNIKSGDAHYFINLRKDYSWIAAGGAFWCPFTLDQIIETLNEITKEFPFEFTVNETKAYYKIHLKVKMSLNKKEHFYILTRVRYLYEFPQSALYFDAYRLRDLPEFSNWSLQDLYTLVVSSIPVVNSDPEKGIIGNSGRSAWYSEYHSIPKNSVQDISSLPSKLDLESLPSKVKMSALNNLYGVIHKTPVKIPYDVDLFNSVKYWELQEGFNLRLAYYRENSNLYTTNKMKADPVYVDYFEDEKDIICKIKVELKDQKEAMKLFDNEHSRKITEVKEFLTNNNK